MEGRRLRQPWLLIAAILMLIIHYSCSDRSDRNSEVLIVGEISDYEALNPIGTSDAHAKDIHPHLFLNLFEEQGDFITFEPRLAKSYSFSEDRSELIVIIRDDVYWSDGTRTTVENVVETLNIQKHPDALWSGRHLKEHVDSAVAINDSTVVFYFNHTYPYQLMDVNDGPILPTHFFAGYETADIRSIPIEEIPTNGPYRIHEWVRGQYLRLIAYEEFYDSPKPYINEVVFKMIPDQSVLITQLLSGEIDCMESIPPMKYHEIKAGNLDITLYNYPSRAYGYLGWRCDHPIFSDAEIRIAMTMAIDREKIVDNLFYGLTEECKGPFVPVIWAYDPDIEAIPFDPIKAKETLALKGYTDSDGDGWLDKDGEIFKFKVLTNQGNQIRADIAVMVQAMLADIGVKVEPVLLEWTYFLERYKAREFDAVIQAWRTSTKADLAPIWSCEAAGPTGYNRVNYCNHTVDSLNSIATSLFDPSEATAPFFEAQRIIYSEQPYTFLYLSPALCAVRSSFIGIKPTAISFYHNLYEWKHRNDE